MAIRDNTQTKDFTEKFRKHRPAFIAAAAAYVVALLVTCGWVANIADKDLGLISSKTMTMEQIKAMANMGYWLGKTWFWSLLIAVILIYILVKAAGEEKVSTGKAAFLAAASVVVVLVFRGWTVISKGALFKSLLGHWPTLVIIAVAIWLAKKFWPKIKGFFGYEKPKEEPEKKSKDESKGEPEEGSEK